MGENYEQGRLRAGRWKQVAAAQDRTFKEIDKEWEARTMRDADLPKLRKGERRPKGRRMKTKEAKAKGRRLQKTVAEMCSAALGLTIEATPTGSVGPTPDDAQYVREGDGGDLRVRRMSEPGADVALLSKRAQNVCAVRRQDKRGLPLRLPIWWECKNTEKWDLGWGFWKNGDAKFISDTLAAAQKSAHPGWEAVVVLGKNNWPPIAVLRRLPLGSMGWPLLVTKQWVALPLGQFLAACVRPWE